MYLNTTFTSKYTPIGEVESTITFAYMNQSVDVSFPLVHILLVPRAYTDSSFNSQLYTMSLFI